MIRNSIIIPTCKSENLIPCVESIRKFTDLTDTEIIVVCNGYDTDFPKDVEVVFHEKMIGYPAAINAGAKVAKGEFLILLNDDTILLTQPKNQWIEILSQPFTDPRAAVTGPWMNWCPYAERDFLLFFCVMIRKSVFEQFGGLDVEAFTAGYGEDCDFCCKSELAGYRNVQVPQQGKLEYNGQMALGNFPIYHAGNQTFKDHPDSDLIWRNRAILKERYTTNIGKARELDGFMSDEELRWLAQRARQSKVFVQIGAWHGKSSRVIADNLPPDGKLYDIDKWTGSQAEMDTNHWSARLLDGDHAFDEYARGMWDYLVSGKVTPLKMLGKNGAALLKDMGIQADTVFIDGGHGPTETHGDIISFLPLRKQGGIIAGHDYMHEDGMWPDVGPEVKAIFGTNVGQPTGTHIWYTDSDPIPRKPDIYDCFIFNNEVEILERRLRTLWNVVDRFVIVEATKTHSGKEKELVFEKCPEFLPYRSKVSYIVVNDMPEVEGTITDKSWARERHQRDAIMRGLTGCKDNDIILVSDVDELVSPEAIRNFTGDPDICSLEMQLFYYDENTIADELWRDAKILTYKKLKELTPCGARYQTAPVIPNAGRHLSYFGGIDSIVQKIENTAHQEYNTDFFKDRERIAGVISSGSDIFEREHIKFKKNAVRESRRQEGLDKTLQEVAQS